MAEDYKLEDVRNLYLECLREEGYVPKLDEEGDITFKKEGQRFYVAIKESDLAYINLSTHGTYNDLLRDRNHAFEVINDIQFKYKAVKMLLFDGDEMSILFKIENFLESPVQFQNVLLRSLNLLFHVMTRFEKLVTEFDATLQSSD